LAPDLRNIATEAQRHREGGDFSVPLCLCGCVDLPRPTIP
jgi:hypothetical protein